MKVTGTDGEEITVVIISTDFIISKGAWPPSLPTITSIGNKPEVLKGCIKLHADTPDTPNWYLNIINRLPQHGYGSSH